MKYLNSKGKEKTLQASSKEKAGCLPRKKHQTCTELTCNTVVDLNDTMCQVLWGENYDSRTMQTKTTLCTQRSKEYKFGETGLKKK